MNHAASTVSSKSINARAIQSIQIVKSLSYLVIFMGDGREKKIDPSAVGGAIGADFPIN